MFIEIGHYFIIVSLLLLIFSNIFFLFDIFFNYLIINYIYLKLKFENFIKYLLKNKYLNYFYNLIRFLKLNFIYDIKFIKNLNIIKGVINYNLFKNLINFTFIYITITLLFLFFSYILSDFSVINIISHSHTNQPLLYKICGLWGNTEGSITFWAWVLSFYTLLLFLFNKSFMKKVLIIISFIQIISVIFFFLFIIFTSNPFIKIIFFFKNGMELNPILQDPVLAIHPPFLYFGYLGFSINFGLAVILLISNFIPKYWKVLMKTFNLISWCLLTIGIGLGSWWAYYELGWGGWWFWDAVENISLIPWLLSTALIHNLLINQKLDKLNNWSIIFSLFIFFSSILGTFFVRSGLLISVHSFAQDYSKTLYLLLYLIFIVSIIYLSLKINYNKISYFTYFNFFSKENFIIINIIFIIIGTLIIILGTFLPIILSKILSHELLLGTDFFNKTLIPLLLPFLCLMAITPFILWGQDNIYRFLSIQNFTFGFLFFFLLKFIYVKNFNSIILFIIIFVSLWIFINLMILISLKIKNGMVISHLGIVFFIISASISSKFKSVFIDIIKPGDNIYFNNYNYIFRNISYGETKNYYTFISNFIIENKWNRPVGIIFPERRSYFLHHNLIAKPAINSNYFSDIYITIGDGNIYNGWFIKIIFNPLITGIWISIFLIFIGGLLSINLLKKKKQQLLLLI